MLAVYHDIRSGVAAQAVGTMDAAGNLAAGVQVGDDFSIAIQYLRIRIDLQTIHRMMHGYYLLAGIPRAFGHLFVRLVVGDKSQGTFQFAARDGVIVIAGRKIRPKDDD